MKDAARAPIETTARPLAGIENPGVLEIDGDDGASVSVLRGAVPPWQRDIVAVSARVRSVLETLRPVVVRVLTFWDHAVRSLQIGARRFEVDPSGSYRLR